MSAPREVPRPGRRRAKRSLSQNFLVDPNLQRKIVDELGAGAGDTVLEIGPGHGELSDRLVGRVRRLILVEKDDDLARDLADRLGGREDVAVVPADALRVDLGRIAGPGRPLRVLSNIPYAITSPLLFRLLAIEPAADRIVVTVQREVARRIAAGPGSRAYGALSVGVQTRARPRIAFPIGRHAFRPAPRVESAAVVLEPLAAPVGGEDLEDLRRLTRIAFGQRRKQLGGILRGAAEYGLSREGAERLLSHLGLRHDLRPERLTPEDFVRLARALRSLA
ncbi:MAG: 16S rRNA (adenine(1518)-N(6)/adenine(1519)-N(6))-dimethyltransferase RsmA [Gemmatimonadota bacterium]